MSATIYHNHIPRTSGTDILYELQRASKKPGSRLSIYTPGILEFAYDKEKTKQYNCLSGHFASNPSRELDDVVTFLLVRNPVDQYISSAAYRFMTDGLELTPERLDRYIDGEFDSFGAFPGFSGCNNPQSKFIAGQLIKFSYSEAQNDDMYALVDEPSSLSDVLKYISTSTSIVGSLENRGGAIERLNNFLKSTFCTEISTNTRKTNSTVPLKFTVTLSQRSKIASKVQLDEEVYHYVKMLEKKENARLQ